MAVDFDFPQVTDSESYSPLEDGTYLFKVADLEDPGPGDYGNPRVKWITHVAEKVNGSWVAVLNEDGSPYEKWIFSNLPKNDQPMGPKQETRVMIEAIIGRTLADEEKPSPSMVLNKYFTAMLGPYRRKKDNALTQILLKDSIKSHTFGGRNGKAAPAPPPPPVEESEPSGDSELPF